MPGLGFMECLSLSYSCWCDYVPSPLICRSHSASLWISFRRNCSMCSWTFWASGRTGNFRSLLCCYLGLESYYLNETNEKWWNGEITICTWYSLLHLYRLICYLTFLIVHTSNKNVKVIQASLYLSGVPAFATTTWGTAPNCLALMANRACIHKFCRSIANKEAIYLGYKNTSGMRFMKKERQGLYMYP